MVIIAFIITIQVNMKIERVKNFKQGIVYGTINRFVTIFLQFVVRTVIIKKLGADYLGINSLFTSILQVLNLTELGLSNAIVYSMYKPIALDERKSICAYLSYYKKIYKIIGSIIMIIGLTILPFLPYLVKDDYPEDINIYYVFIIYLINTAISYFLFAYKQSILQAFQRNDLISIINSIVMIAQYVVQIVILFVFNNYYLYTLATIMFTIINNIAISYTTKKYYPEFICVGQIDKSQRKELKKHIKGIMVSKICFTLRNGIDSIIISAFLGLELVAIYNNYYYILTAILGIFNVIVNSLTAGIGNSIVCESVDKNYEDMCKVTFLYSWLAGLCTCFLLCLYQPFMNIWVGSKYLLSNQTMYMCCIYFYANTMGHIKGMYQDAVGLWWEARNRAIIETIMNLILNVTLVNFWGVSGIILASVTTLIFINFGMGTHIVFKHYFKEKKIGTYFGQYSRYIFLTVVGCICSYLLSNHLLIENLYLNIFVRMIICMLVFNLIYLLSSCNYVWFKKSLPLMKRIIKKRG